MKIELNSTSISNSSAVETQKKETVSPKTNSRGAEAQNYVEISDEARVRQNALSLARQAPDFNADKVAKIKEKIKQGDYNVDSSELAQKILDDHLQNHFGKNNL